MTSECFFCTGPMVFHSFCSLVNFSAVTFQSVLSFKASACSHNAFFRSRLLLSSSFNILKCSAFRLKKSSHALRNRSNIFTFIFCGANPMVFHLACSAMISFVLFSQSRNVFNLSYSVASTISQITVFWSRLRCSSSLIFS